MEDYLALNRANWDERAPLHAASPGYALDQFRRDPRFLSNVVRYDLPRLGEIAGLRGVHLQCHIGTDTISLARLGARMTGLDFSTASLAEARDLATETGADVRFVAADVQGAVEALGEEQFDFVYTGIGALCWLPSIERWAETVARLLRPGGRLFIREGHPVLWALDDERTDVLALTRPYFEQDDPMIWDEPGTYVDTDTPIVSSRSADWNHGIGEILTALLGQGLELTEFIEHVSVPWEALPGQMRRGELDEWYLNRDPAPFPLSYTLQAIKRPKTA